MSRARRVVPSPAAVPAREPWWREPAPWVALLSVLAWLPTLRYGFVWDDARLVVHDASLGAWGPLLRALVSDFWAGSGTPSGFWRPLVTASFAADRLLFQGAPWGFHLTNVLAGAGAAALVTMLARRLGADRPAAALAGACWALSPSHVESMAWISGRSDVFAALGTLLALVLDRRARDRGAAWPGAAPLLAAAAALLAKEAALLLPLFVAVLDRVDGATPRRGTLRWSLPYVALVAAWGAAHAFVVTAAPPPPFVDEVAQLRGRLAGALALPGYVGFLWPFATHTPAAVLPTPEHVGDPRVWAGAALHALALAGLIAMVVRRSPFAVALAVFWGGLLPAIAVGFVQQAWLYSERFLYLPSAGAAWALALAITRMRWPWRHVGRGLALVLLVVSGVVTLRTQPDWRDDDALFTSMTRKGPRHAQGWTQLARLRLVQGRDEEASRALAEATRLAPARPEVVTLRALIHYRRGEWPAVLALVDTALALDPGLPEPRIARATALLRMGRLDEAGDELATLRARLPGNATVASLEGQRYVALRRPDDALPLLARAATEVTDDPDLFYALGMAHAYRSEVPDARAAFTRATEIDPRFYDAWLRLATACHLLGDVPARDVALARASGLPDAVDGRVSELTRRLAALGAGGSLNP